MGTVSALPAKWIYYLDLPKCLYMCSGFSGFPFHLDAFLSIYLTYLHHLRPPASHTLLNSSFIYSLIQRLCLEHLPLSGSVPGTGDVLVVKTHMSSDLIELSFLGKTDTKQIYKYMYNYHVSCVHWRKRTGCRRNE